MIEALTLRGFEDPDTIKPDNRKSEDEKSLTEDRNPKSHSRRNLSKDHDGIYGVPDQTDFGQKTVQDPRNLAKETIGVWDQTD